MAVQTYAVYTRCGQCGVYDRDPDWCALCGRPKDGKVAPAGHANGGARETAAYPLTRSHNGAPAGRAAAKTRR